MIRSASSLSTRICEELAVIDPLKGFLARWSRSEGKAHSGAVSFRGCNISTCVPNADLLRLGRHSDIFGKLMPRSLLEIASM